MLENVVINSFMLNVRLLSAGGNKQQISNCTVSVNFLPQNLSCITAGVLHLRMKIILKYVNEIKSKCALTIKQC